MRGFFEIGVFHSKTEFNIGTLWRSAYQLGAAGVFVIGRRYDRQASDTYKAWRHIPLREFSDLDMLLASLPYSTKLVGVEMGGVPLATYEHPERCIYLLGAEDTGLPDAVLGRCHDVVSIEAIRRASYNVAVAGSLVMYHRLLQKG